MLRAILTRLVEALLLAWLVASLSFALLQLAPGDAFSATVGDPRVSSEMRSQLRERYGLDQPAGVQYLRYIAALAKGELGYSLVRQRPVRDVLATALPYSMALVGLALFVGAGVAVVLGTWQAYAAGRAPDHWLGTAFAVLSGVPEVWLGLLALALFSVQLGWFPMHGACDVETCGSLTGLQALRDYLYHLALPALSLAAVYAAPFARLQRVAVRAQLGDPIIRAAHARGLPPHVIRWRYVVRVSLRPMVQNVSLALPALVGGAVFVERIFGWPGMGSVLVDAVMGRDHFLLTAVVFMASLLIVLGRVGADLVAYRLDPRLRPAST